MEWRSTATTSPSSARRAFSGSSVRAAAATSWPIRFTAEPRANDATKVASSGDLRSVWRLSSIICARSCASPPCMDCRKRKNDLHCSSLCCWRRWPFMPSAAKTPCRRPRNSSSPELLVKVVRSSPGTRAHNSNSFAGRRVIDVTSPTLFPAGPWLGCDRRGAGPINDTRLEPRPGRSSAAAPVPTAALRSRTDGPGDAPVLTCTWRPAEVPCRDSPLASGAPPGRLFAAASAALVSIPIVGFRCSFQQTGAPPLRFSVNAK